MIMVIEWNLSFNYLLPLYKERICGRESDWKSGGYSELVPKFWLERVVKYGEGQSYHWGGVRETG